MGIACITTRASHTWRMWMAKGNAWYTCIIGRNRTAPTLVASMRVYRFSSWKQILKRVMGYASKSVSGRCSAGSSLHLFWVGCHLGSTGRWESFRFFKLRLFWVGCHLGSTGRWTGWWERFRLVLGVAPLTNALSSKSTPHESPH